MPRAARPGHGALDQQQVPLGVRAHDGQLPDRRPTVAHVPGHLLVLEDAARILALASRTECTVRDRYAVRCTHTAETPTLHAASKALALRVARNVDHLAGDEVRSSNG